jgi:hypothetical protein
MLKTKVESTGALSGRIVALALGGMTFTTSGRFMTFAEPVDSRITGRLDLPFMSKSDSHPSLLRLSGLQAGWDGCGAPAPSQNAIYWADRLLSQAEQNGMMASHVMACVDGGVTIQYHGKQTATIEFFNSGEMVVAKSAGPGTTTVQEFIQSGESITQAVEEASGFVS